MKENSSSIICPESHSWVDWYLHSNWSNSKIFFRISLESRKKKKKKTGNYLLSYHHDLKKKNKTVNVLENFLPFFFFYKQVNFWNFKICFTVVIKVCDIAFHWNYDTTDCEMLHYSIQHQKEKSLPITRCHWLRYIQILAVLKYEGKNCVS